MVEKIFLLPPVNRRVIISNKLVDMSCLTNFRTNYYLALSPPSEIKILPVLAKIFWKIFPPVIHMKTTVCLK